MLTSKLLPGLTVDSEGTALTTAFAVSVVVVVVLGIAVGSVKIGVVVVVDATEELLHPLNNMLRTLMHSKIPPKHIRFLVTLFNFYSSLIPLFLYSLVPNLVSLFWRYLADVTPGRNPEI